MKPFVILTSARTGSTFLRYWLNGHPKIRCHGEVFLRHYRHPDGLQYFSKKSLIDSVYFKIYANKLLRKYKINLHPKFFLRKFLNSLLFDPEFPSPWTGEKGDTNKTVQQNTKPVVGFKAMYNHVSCAPFLKEWLSDESVYVIHLTRSNLLSKYISHKKMSVSNVAHVTSGEYYCPPITICINEIKKFFKRNLYLESQQRSLYGNKKHFLEFSYEDFFSNREKTANAIFNFLDVEYCQLSEVKLKKIGSTRLRDEVSNADELISFLKGTNYEKFLDRYEL